MAEIPPVARGRSHSTDLQDPRHSAALGTALRYQTAAGMATQRALRALFTHRKAVKDGLAPAAADGERDGVPAPAPLPEPANQNCTNEFPALPEPEPPTPEHAEPELGCAVAPAAGGEDADEDEELDDEAWLETVPVVEADPEREAERRRLLLAVEHKGARDAIKHAPLRGIEQYSVAGDPVAYEEWFARQPKPPREPGQLPDRGGRRCGRVGHPPQPALDQGPVSRLLPPARAGAPVSARGEADRTTSSSQRPTRAASRRRRPTRPGRATCRHGSPACSTAAARLAEELDLAEAICALKWPKWPDYRGAIDPFLLRGRCRTSASTTPPSTGWAATSWPAPAGRRARTRASPACV